MEVDIYFIFLAVSIITSFMLGLLVLFHGLKSKTNLFFCLFILMNIGWAILNYLPYNLHDPNLNLIMLRLALFFGMGQSYFFYLLMRVFPQNTYQFSYRTKYITTSIVSIVALLSLTPLFFQSVTLSSNGVYIPVVSPAIILFGATAISLVGAGLYTIIKKTRKYNLKDRGKYQLLLWGVGIMFSAIIVFNFIFPAFLNNTDLIPLSTVFTLPFVILTSLSIIKYQLFNIKVIATELLVFTLWLFLLIRIFFYTTTLDQIISIGLFIILLIVGIFLIKSVRKEVEQREELETLTHKLEKANKKLKSLDKLKTEFLSLASHQLRSPLTSIRGYASMLTEEAFGKLNKKQKEPIERIYLSSNHLAKIVEDLLNVSKIEQGGMKYEFSTIDLGQLVTEITNEMQLAAEKKELELQCSAAKGTYFIHADEEKMRQVIMNLIDNAIKYTQEGFVRLALEEKADMITIAISDSGMGMSEETKEELFQKFSRGKGGTVNTGGSGLGLYLAKEIVAAHDGSIWVESPGEGKGSTFYVSLPKVSAPDEKESPEE